MTACITVMAKSMRRNSRALWVTADTSVGASRLIDLIVFGLISTGSSREILMHLLAKLAGNCGTGMTLIQRRNLLWIGKGIVSGNTSSFINFSSGSSGRISLFSSASFYYSSKSSNLASSSSLASYLRRLMIVFNRSWRASEILKLLSSTLISPWCQLLSGENSLKDVSAESCKMDY